MAVLLPHSLSLPQPTHLSPFRFRGFINIASLQGRSVHPLGIPVCLRSLIFFFILNCIFKNINKWSTICNSIISPISRGQISKRSTRILWSRKPRVIDLQREPGSMQEFICLSNKPPPLHCSELSYHRRTQEMKEGHKVPPCQQRTLTYPLETKQNRTAFGTTVVCLTVATAIVRVWVCTNHWKCAGVTFSSLKVYSKFSIYLLF